MNSRLDFSGYRIIPNAANAHMSKGKKRFWSDDEKREICGQTFGSGVSVAQVALRFAANANLIHKWLRDPRFSKSDRDVIDAVGFLPIELSGNSSAAEGLSRLAPDRSFAC